jgi:hypothetical protein
MSYNEIKIVDSEPRIFYDKFVDLDQGKQYKGQWYVHYTISSPIN